MTTASTIYRSQTFKSSFWLSLFQQVSILSCNLASGVTCVETQLILERLHVLWLRRRNRSLKREMAQQFIAALYCSSKPGGRPSSQPVSVGTISQKLPMQRMLLMTTYSPQGIGEGKLSRLIMKVFPWPSSKARWFSMAFSSYTSSRPVWDTLRIMENGSAMTQQLLMRLMPRVILNLSKKQFSLNHLVRFLALNYSSGALRSSRSEVATSFLKGTIPFSPRRRVQSLSMDERYLVSNLIQFHNEKVNELRYTSWPIQLTISSSFLSLLKTYTEQYFTSTPNTCVSLTNSSTIFSSIMKSLSRSRYMGRVASTTTPITEAVKLLQLQ